MPIDQPKPAAPYLPWRTFLNSLDVFSQAVPPKIYRSVWRQSGLMQGLIMGAYRFMGLVDADDKPTGILVVLVSPETRQAAMTDVLKSSYTAIFTHDLASMTIDTLNEEIEKYNVSGGTKKKAVTFFLQAAKYAGLPLSPFIQVRSTTGTRRRRMRNGEEGEEDPGVNASKTGSEKVVELASGGTVTLRVSVDLLSLTEADRRFVFELVDTMNNYDRSTVRTVRRLGAS